MRDEPPAYEETAGSSSSAIPGDNKTQLQDESQRSQYGLISFSGYDRVRLMRFPESIVPLVSETLQKHWPKGIQNVKAYYESTEFKLRGNPFEHGSDDEKIALRNVILGLLDALAREGWGVHPAAGGLGRIGNYKSLGQKGMFVCISTWDCSLLSPSSSSPFSVPNLYCYSYKTFVPIEDKLTETQIA